MAKEDTLVIHEIYASIQGESTFAGVPCTFVRTTGCNLRCSWCDTTQAFKGGTRMRRADVLEKALAFDTPLVEVTGGEPLLQPGVLPLMSELCDAGRTVLIETSGEADIAKVDPRVHRIMDLKAPLSGESHRNRLSNLEGELAGACKSPHAPVVAVAHPKSPGCYPPSFGLDAGATRLFILGDGPPGGSPQALGQLLVRRSPGWYAYGGCRSGHRRGAARWNAGPNPGRLRSEARADQRRLLRVQSSGKRGSRGRRAGRAWCKSGRYADSAADIQKAEVSQHSKWKTMYLSILLTIPLTLALPLIMKK